jgi:hypothetical protein
MTSKLQNPSTNWKTGVDHRSSLSQFPIVKLSTSPSRPKSQPVIEVSSALFPLKVRSTHPLVSESIENRLSDQMSKAGTISHCVERMRTTKE